jgi:hypothetical protein
METVTLTEATANEATDATRDDLVMTMLQEHVPLALLCDLTETDGPSSQEILSTEGEPADRWWE